MWYLGVFITLAGAVLANVGLNVQKLAFRKESERAASQGLPTLAGGEGVVAEAGGSGTKSRPPWKLPLWYLGLLLFAIGNLADFFALKFAAQSLVTALGGVSILCNTVVAPLMNHEPVGIRDYISALLIVAGVTLVILFSYHADVAYSICELLALYRRPAAIVLLSAIGVTVISLFIFIKIMEPRRLSGHREREEHEVSEGVYDEVVQVTDEKKDSAEMMSSQGRREDTSEKHGSSDSKRGFLDENVLSVSEIDCPVLSRTNDSSASDSPPPEYCIATPPPTPPSSSPTVVPVSPASSLTIAPIKDVQLFTPRKSSSIRSVSSSHATISVRNSLAVGSLDEGIPTSGPETCLNDRAFSAFQEVDTEKGKTGSRATGGGGLERPDVRMAADDLEMGQTDDEHLRCTTNTRSDITESVRQAIDIPARARITRPSNRTQHSTIEQQSSSTPCTSSNKKPHNCEMLLIRYGLPFAYAAVGGVSGVLTVLLAKTTSEIIIGNEDRSEGTDVNATGVIMSDARCHGNPFAMFETWIFGVCLIVSALTQIALINSSLKRYEALTQVPIYYVIWTILNVITGAIFFSEFQHYTPLMLAIFSIGILLTFSGVLLTARRFGKQGGTAENPLVL
ncbi:NIPA-like protein 3 [Quaeritorhiza haematococci]|nr:NIPA-like protein 3 [Quaeritorhiza haematococci]